MDGLSKGGQLWIVCHDRGKLIDYTKVGDESRCDTSVFLDATLVAEVPLIVSSLGEIKNWKCKNCLNNFESCKTRVSYDLVIFREEHQCRLLRREAWSSFEVSVGITEEGEVVTYLRFIANFSKIVKPLTSLTERNQKYEWGAEREEAF
ncbi:hypothetical protein Tco_1211156 [Tanacetum coccineum]